MVDGTIPWKLNGGIDDKDEHGPPGVKVGLALNRPMTATVQASCDGLSIAQRKERLRDANPLVWTAYDMASRNKSHALIAAALEQESEQGGIRRRFALRTVRLYVKLGRDFMARDARPQEEPESPDAKFQRLKLLRPDAADTYLGRSWNLPLEAIQVALPAYTLMQLAELHAEAVAYMGAEHRPFLSKQGHRKLGAA